MMIHGSAELSRMLMLQRQAVDVRGAIDRAALEMTTGQKADKVKATGGNLARLFSIERMLDKVAVYQNTISLTEMRLDVMQDGLGRVVSWAEGVAVDLASATAIGDLSAARIHAQTARRAFADTVGMLNTQVAGQSLFAGTATGGPALAGAEVMLAHLDGLAAGVPAATAIARIEDYFSGTAAVNFFTDGYVGADEGLAAAEIGEGVRLDYAVRADDAALVAALKAQAIAAVVAGGAAGAPPADQMAMLGEAGRQLLAAKEGLLDLRAEVGVAQETVERAKAQRVAEFATYDQARAKIVGADPYEAASSYQALLAQLEALFTVTARLSTLRFVNFIR